MKKGTKIWLCFAGGLIVSFWPFCFLPNGLLLVIGPVFGLYDVIQVAIYGPFLIACIQAMRGKNGASAWVLGSVISVAIGAVLFVTTGFWVCPCIAVRLFYTLSAIKQSRIVNIWMKKEAQTMSHAIWFISYKLKKGASVEDFLIASKKCNDEVLSRQKGYISWDVLRDEDTWVDLVKWETAEDAKNAETAGAGNPASREFYSFINMNSCKLQLYSIEKSH